MRCIWTLKGNSLFFETLKRSESKRPEETAKRISKHFYSSRPKICYQPLFIVEYCESCAITRLGKTPASGFSLSLAVLLWLLGQTHSHAPMLFDMTWHIVEMKISNIMSYDSPSPVSHLGISYFVFYLFFPSSKTASNFRLLKNQLVEIPESRLIFVLFYVN